MNKKDRKCPKCGGIATYNKTIFKCKDCNWEGWTEVEYKHQGENNMSAKIEVGIIQYLKDHKSSDGKGIKLDALVFNLKYNREQITNALQRLKSKQDSQISNIGHGRYEHIENVERPPPSETEPPPKEPTEINAALGESNGSCSVEFFVNTIDQLKKEHGGRSINQSELNKLINLLNDVEKLYIGLKPKI